MNEKFRGERKPLETYTVEEWAEVTAFMTPGDREVIKSYYYAPQAVRKAAIESMRDDLEAHPYYTTYFQLSDEALGRMVESFADD